MSAQTSKPNVKQYAFRPIDSSCSRFVEVNPLSVGLDKISAIGPQIGRLEQLFQEYMKLVQKDSPKMFTFYPIKSNVPLIHVQHFCLSILKEYQSIIQKETEQFYAQCIYKSSQLIDFLKDCSQNGYAVKCDTEGFASQMEKEYANMEQIAESRKRISQIDCFANNLLAISQPKNKDYESILPLLRESASLANLKTEFCPYSQFDDVFLSYVEENGYWPIFDQTASRLTKSYKSGAIKISEAFAVIPIFASIIKPHTKEEAMTLKCSIFRVLFDRICMTLGDQLKDQPDISHFQKNCAIISNATPNQLKIGPKLMTPELMDLSFHDVVRCSSPLTNAANILKTIPFETSPLDIISLLFDSLKEIECFININCRLQKNGTIAVEQPGEEAQNSLSFDDIFSVYLPLFASSPPANAVAVSDFLQRCGKFSLSSSFDYSRMIFNSAVNFILHFEENDLGK